jgi:hypothetical protein
LLHIATLLCWMVLGEPGTRASRLFMERTLRRRRLLRTLLPATVGIGLIEVGVFVATGTIRHVPSIDIWAAVLIVGGSLVAAAGLLGRSLVRVSPATHGFGERRVATDEASERAQQFLEEIKFQQTYTSGWSGGLTLAVGLSGNYEQNTSRAALTLSFPEVARELATEGLPRAQHVRVFRGHCSTAVRAKLGSGTIRSLDHGGRTAH